MASFYGVNQNNAFNVLPSLKIDVTDWHGRVRKMADSYVQPASALSIGDKIYMGRLPVGAKILQAYLQSSNFGATGVVDVGIEYVNSADGSPVTNGIFSAVGIHTAALMSNMNAQAAPGLFEVALAGEANLVVNVTTGTDATGGSLKLVVLYVID